MSLAVKRRRRSLVTYAGTATGAQNANGFTTTLTATGSYTATAGDTILLGYTSRNTSQLRSAQTRTVTYGGSPMTLLGFNDVASADWFSELWILANAPGGAQATAVTVASGSNTGRAIALGTVSVSGFGRAGTITTNTTGGTSVAITSVASAPGELVVAMFSSSQGALTSFTPNSRITADSSDNNANIVLGDATGAATVNFAATVASGVGAYGIAARLIPVTT